MRQAEGKAQKTRSKIAKPELVSGIMGKFPYTYHHYLGGFPNKGGQFVRYEVLPKYLAVQKVTFFWDGKSYREKGFQVTSNWEDKKGLNKSLGIILLMDKIMHHQG